MTVRLLRRNKQQVLGITFSVAGVLLVITGFLTWGITGKTNFPEYMIFGLGVVLIICGIFLSKEYVSNIFTSGKFAKGGNSVILITGVIAIIIFLNILVTRHHIRKDMTADKNFSLSQQTIDVLNTIDIPIKMMYFYTNQDSGFSRMSSYAKKEQLNDLLMEYSYQNSNIQAEYVDADKEMGLTKSYEINQYGTMIIEAGARKKEISDGDLFEDNFFMAQMQGRSPDPVRFMGEQEITSALLEVLSDETNKIYFLTGHGEKSIKSNEHDGYRLVREYIEREVYEINDLNLLDEEKVPDDCSILVIAGPKKPLFENDSRAIKEYLNQGGNAYMMLEPASEDSRLKEILRECVGLKLVDGIVIDPRSVLQDGTAPAPVYSYHPIVEALRKKEIYTVLFGARGIKQVENPPDDLAIKDFFNSSEGGWSEQDFDDEVKSELIEMNEDKDIKGPFGLGYTVERKIQEVPTIKPRTENNDEPDSYEDGRIEFNNESSEGKRDQRIVVIGDSDFITNEIISSIPQNIDLFMNSISWIIGKKEGLTIRPKDINYPILTMTQIQSKLVMFITTIISPLIILIIGIAVLLKRRNA